MNSLGKYDLNQIRLIEKRINLFECCKLSLFDLVCDLNGISNTLECITDAWRDDFQIQVNTLEMIRDSIKDGSISKWIGDFKEDIHGSVSKIKQMTASILESYLKIPDPNIAEHAMEAYFNWLICPICNDAWISDSLNAMVVCPKCECALHNPHTPKNKRTRNV